MVIGGDGVSHQSKIVGWLEPQSEAQVRTLLQRARGGDPTSLAELRQALDRHPEIWQSYGNLAKHARDALIDLVAGPDLVLKESLERQVEAMRLDLAGANRTPLQDLLISRIVTCWIQLGHADAAMAQAGDISIQQGNYFRKNQDSAHRRYLTAVGALAMSRRLLGSAGVQSGKAMKAELPSTGPADDVGADPASDGLEEQGDFREEGDQTEDGLALEFGPAIDRSSIVKVPGRRRHSKDSSKS
jgi:hypothetical protein